MPSLCHCDHPLQLRSADFCDRCHLAIFEREEVQTRGEDKDMPITDGIALITDEEKLAIILERMLLRLDVNNGINDIRAEMKFAIEEIQRAGFRTKNKKYR